MSHSAMATSFSFQFDLLVLKLTMPAKVAGYLTLSI